jgi:hypothetical protein
LFTNLTDLIWITQCGWTIGEGLIDPGYLCLAALTIHHNGRHSWRGAKTLRIL